MESDRTYKQIFDELISSFKRIDSPDVADKVAHIERVSRMAVRVAPFDETLILCAEYHDLPGRMMQYDVLSKIPGAGVFDDSILDHHVLSEIVFRRLIREEKLKSSRTLDIIRATAQNHGLENLWPESFSKDCVLKYYVKTISILDDIDNGCLGALSYIAREIDTDAKSKMLENNGSLTLADRHSGVVSQKVLECFKNKEKFDKFSECKTYADYLIFAIILGVQFLKSDYSDLTKLAIEAFNSPCGNYPSAVLGYKDLIDRYVCDAQKEQILTIFDDILATANTDAKYRYFDLGL